MNEIWKNEYYRNLWFRSCSDSSSSTIYSFYKYKRPICMWQAVYGIHHPYNDKFFISYLNCYLKISPAGIYLEK